MPIAAPPTRAVHFGVLDDDVRDFIDEITGLHPQIIEVTCEGDGWNAWGAEPGEDCNDEHTMHVVAIVPTDMALDPLIGSLQEEGWLRRMTDEDDPIGDLDPTGEVAVVTDIDDFEAVHRSWY